MKIKYEIQTDKKGLVTTFESKEEAEKYLSENSDKNYVIKNKRVWSWIEYLLFVLVFLIVKYLGLIAGVGILVGYFLHRYLENRINKYLSLLISLVFGILVYVIGLYFITESLK